MSYVEGDLVTVGYDGRTVEARIILASSNGRSLAIGFAAVLGGFVCRMPVLRDHAGIYRDLVHNEPVTIEPRTLEHGVPA